MSDGSLRDQQAEFTRQLLINAAQQVIQDHSVDEFSIQKVAEQAGVSHRTVYRYFRNRHELLDAVTDWIENNVAVYASYPPRNADEIGTIIHRVYDQFDRYAPYYRASVLLANHGNQIQPEREREREDQLRDALAELLAPLDEAQAEEVYVVIRLLVSAQAWLTMRDRFGLAEGQTGDAVNWAIDALVQALRDGHAPAGDPGRARTDARNAG